MEYVYVISVRIDTYDPENYVIFRKYEDAERAVHALIRDNEDTLYDWDSDGVNLFHWFTEKGTYRVERLPLL